MKDTFTIDMDEDMHNVVAILSGQRVVFACLDEEHAKELKEQLERTAWAQIEGRAQ